MKSRYIKSIQCNVAKALRDISQVDTTDANLDTKLLLGNAQYRLSILNNDALLELDNRWHKNQKAAHSHYIEFNKALTDRDLYQGQAVDLASHNAKDSKAKLEEPRFANCLAQDEFMHIYYDGRKKRWLLDFDKPIHSYDYDLIKAYLASKRGFLTDPKFVVTKHNSLLADTRQLAFTNKNFEPLIVNIVDIPKYFKGHKKIKSNSLLGKYIVTDTFIQYIGSADSWKGIAGGQFEKAMCHVIQHKFGNAKE